MGDGSRGTGECVSDRDVAAIVVGDSASDVLVAAMQHAAECDACRELLAVVGRVRAAAVSRAATDAASDGAAAPTETAVLPPGTTLGRYRVGRELGRGGMGVVYEGHDPELARRVAIKVMHGGADTSKLARMSREAQAVAALSHPNVVQIFDVSLAADPAFIVMEFVHGATLRAWVRDHHPHWRTVLDAYLHAARGLAAAHAAGLVHRDFKPGNAMIDDAGSVKVLDFGLARADGETSLSSGGDIVLPAASTTLTATGIGVGTPSYMAPEQHRGERVDARADVYGFAVALYEALYGRLPFEAQTVEHLFVLKERGIDRAPPRSEIPEAMHVAIAEALAFEPSVRWASMDAFASALRHAARRRRPAMWMLAAIAAASLVGAAALDPTPALGDTASSAVVVDPRLGVEAIDLIGRARAEDPGRRTGTAMAAMAVAAASGSLRVTAHAEIEVGHQLAQEHAWELALAWLRDGIADATATGDDHAIARGTIRSMDALNELRRFPEALDAARQARSSLERIGGDATLLAPLLAAEARALPMGDPNKIIRYEEALALRRADPNGDPIALAATLNNIGAVVGGDDPLRARALFSEALQLREQAQGHDHPDTLVTALNLVGLDYEVGNYTACVKRGAEVHRVLPEAQREARAMSAEIVAGCSIELRAFTSGLEWIERALAIQAALDDGGTSYAGMLETKAVLLSHVGKWEETEALLHRALVIREATARGPSTRVAHSHYRLAVVARELGELDRAENYARRSLAEAEALADLLGTQHARTILANILLDRGRPAEAVEVLAGHVDVVADESIDPMYFAVAKGVYARASWEVGDRVRARELVREALDALGRRPDFVFEHDELVAWLATKSGA